MRVQLELHDKRVRVLDELQAELGLPTRKELFNNALTLFEWAVQERKELRKVGSQDPRTGTFREVLMPAFQNLTTDVILVEDSPQPIQTQTQPVKGPAIAVAARRSRR